MKKIPVLLSVLILLSSITSCSKLNNIDMPSSEDPSSSLSSTVVSNYSSSEIPDIDPATINPLTGLADYNKDIKIKRPVCIMISNSARALPQCGINSADIIFETLAEGGITRLMGVYSDVDKIPDVGPIRSSRQYYVKLSRGLDAIFMHWGGSVYAYDNLNQGNISNVDGNKYEGVYYWRDPVRRANNGYEHSGFTSGEKIKQSISDLKFNTEPQDKYYNMFNFYLPDEIITPTGGSCKKLYVPFSNYYDGTYDYHEATRLYKKSQNGEIQVDGNTNVQASVTNILVLYAPVKRMSPENDYIDVDLTGGSGIYVSNGAYQEISWEKGNQEDPLKVKAKDGSELKLNAGKSWVNIFPIDRKDMVTTE